jgi:signal transduction histidine kinase
VKTVLETGEPIEFVRLVEDRKFLSVILPLRQTPEKRGAVEIVKPLALIENDVSRARLNWLSTTLLLLATIFFLVFFVLRQNLSRPIQAVLVGARALGRGDLSYRVAVKDSHDELAQLAAEFNRMAESLAEQRRAAETETETRLNLEKELRHSERLASVGKLASGIAHELGAPLNVIDARAEQLLHSPDVAVEKRIKNLTIIRSQCSRITHIVRQLLNLARPYDLQLEEIRVGDLIRSALEGFEASETIKIDFEANNGLTILGDGDFLRQVFFNIFHNAVHAMSAGGELKIEISKTAHENRNFVVVEISDTGTGIAPDSLERIFEPFYTTKPIGEGTGLGLSVSRRIVEEHGGIIEASNNATNGARFTIYLPTNEEL